MEILRIRLHTTHVLVIYLVYTWFKTKLYHDSTYHSRHILLVTYSNGHSVYLIYTWHSTYLKYTWLMLCPSGYLTCIEQANVMATWNITRLSPFITWFVYTRHRLGTRILHLAGSGTSIWGTFNSRTAKVFRHCVKLWCLVALFCKTEGYKSPGLTS
jgi:hypothetical protein